MSSFCGLFRTDKQRVQEQNLALMLNALSYWDPDDRNTIIKEHIGMGHLMLYNTPESQHEQLPREENDLYITADARIDNREELFQQLSIPREEHTKWPDSYLILMAYRKWGVHCPVHLLGDFAFVIYDHKKGYVYCARDHMGVKPFYYYPDPHYIAFSTEMKGILALPFVQTTINETWVAESISTLKSNKDQTFFNEIFRLPPSHYMIFSKDRKVLKKYWDFAPKRSLHFKKEQDYIEGFREKLFQAVKTRLRSSFPVGIELSGGLDSSAIASTAAHLVDQSFLKTFSHALPPDISSDYPVKDETDQINTMRQFTGISDHTFATAENRGILDAMKNSLKIQDAPTQQNFHLFSDELYQKAQSKGVHTLLSGFGGDELVTSRIPGYLDDLAQKQKWGEYWKALSNRQNINTSKKMRSLFAHLIRQNLPPLYSLLSNIRGKQEDWIAAKFNGLAINADFMDKMQLREHYFSTKGFPHRSTVNERLHDRISHNHISQRLEYCYLAAHAHKIEYRYPLLDKELMEYYMALPLQYKVQQGWSRYITRAAMENLMPEEIRWRTDKSGATIPTTLYRFYNDEKAIFNFISTMKELIPNNYVDYDRLLEGMERIKQYNVKANLPPNPGAFYNSLMILLYQQLDKPIS